MWLTFELAQRKICNIHYNDCILKFIKTNVLMVLNYLYGIIYLYLLIYFFKTKFRAIANKEN